MGLSQGNLGPVVDWCVLGVLATNAGGWMSTGELMCYWLNTVQRDLRAYNLTLNEAVDLAQNRPLWRLMSTYGTTHS